MQIKTELDALERTKDEESKKFKSQNIEFDFQILVRIKEAMVDVSSNCMELALKVLFFFSFFFLVQMQGVLFNLQITHPALIFYQRSL